MSEDAISGLVMLCVVVGLVVLAFYVGTAVEHAGNLNELCEAACARHDKSKRHQADATFCVCTSGTTLRASHSHIPLRTQEEVP